MPLSETIRLWISIAGCLAPLLLAGYYYFAQGKRTPLIIAVAALAIAGLAVLIVGGLAAEKESAGLGYLMDARSRVISILEQRLDRVKYEDNWDCQSAKKNADDIETCIRFSLEDFAQGRRMYGSPTLRPLFTTMTATLEELRRAVVTPLRECESLSEDQLGNLQGDTKDKMDSFIVRLRAVRLKRR
jgi:hypothetical protein